jgi:hypothetical protein
VLHLNYTPFKTNMKQKVRLQCISHWINWFSIYLSFVDNLRIFNTNNTTGITSGAWTAYPSGVLGFTSGFQCNTNPTKNRGEFRCSGSVGSSCLLILIVVYLYQFKIEPYFWNGACFKNTLCTFQWCSCCSVFSFCAVLCQLFVFYSRFSFGYCIVCPSIYGFWLPFRHL